MKLWLTGAALALVCGEALAVAPPRFPNGAVWYQDISAAATDPASTSMINTLAGLCSSPGVACGFGNGRMQIDFSFNIVRAQAGAPLYTITSIPSANPDDAYYLPDCEPLGTSVPVPVGARIEGQSGLTCDVFNDDCHLLVVQDTTLYEVYRANVSGNTIQAQCLVKWRLDTVYPAAGRGEHCTSADAAGFPIAPLLFNADEVAAALAQPNVGDRHLGHAIRFILPNPRMANSNTPANVAGRLYVRPGSHAGAPSGPPGTVAYGARLRLKSSFNIAAYPPAAQVILRTMQRYGIVLADGGTVALTAESDNFTSTTWASLGLGARVFDSTAGAPIVSVSDFEVIDTGPRIQETYDCVPTQLPTDITFANGFE